MRLGPYELEAEIGRGGMGRVYRGRHRTTGAVRAIKALVDADTDPDALVRFQREAAALVRAGGDGVVGVHESGQEGRTLWFAMDLMPGGSLRALMKERGRLPWREACEIVATLAAALGRCHASGLVHRDVKPENVLFDADGRPRVADFGASRDLSASRLTATGVVLGTPGYMAPEQLDGRQADARADVFALGVILHELVTGEKPFKGERHWDLLRAIHAGKFERPSTVVSCPRELDRLLESVLADDAGRRPANGEDLAVELAEVAAGRTTRSLVPVLVGLTALAVLAGAVVARTRRQEAAPPPPPAPIAPVPTRAPTGPSREDLERRESMRRAATALADLIASRQESYASYLSEIKDPTIMLEHKDRELLGIHDDERLEAIFKAGSHEKDPAAWEEALAPVASAARAVVHLTRKPGFGDAGWKTSARAVLSSTLRKLAPRSTRVRTVQRALAAVDLANAEPRKELADECADLVAGVEKEDPVLALHLLNFAWAWGTKRPATSAAMIARGRELRERSSPGDRTWADRIWADLLGDTVSNHEADPDERLHQREEAYFVSVDAYQGTEHGGDDNAHARMLMLVNAFLLAPNAKDFSPEVVGRLGDEVPLTLPVRMLVSACRDARAGKLGEAQRELERARTLAAALKPDVRREEVLASVKQLEGQLEKR
ncbi:MAG TPA: serine/threonine-protein kinase [Planctomycetota bacterium]|nr:serine/threonine-protein kinase [Planctomycetota bacterium]